MKFHKHFNPKVLLMICNFLFLICAVILVTSGLVLFMDTRRVLLSRLLLNNDDTGAGFLSGWPRPLFHYVALGLIAAGFVACSAALLGCVAACADNCFTLTMYALLVVLLLVLQGLACLVLSMWPHCLGLGLDPTTMVRVLQRNYGVPGQEQFTAAMDLAQTEFECCAINDSINYDTSLWRLQGRGNREFAIPLTCCQLHNKLDPVGYLDPNPTNITMCQALTPEENKQHGGRHQLGCLTKIESWYLEQYTIFLTAGLVLVLIEFSVLLSAVLSCAYIPHQREEQRIRRAIVTQTPDEVFTPKALDSCNIENIYQEEMRHATPSWRKHTAINTLRPGEISNIGYIV